ncbi:Zn(II)2Cys6 transcription factor [Aspergillus sclerotioniger CBS 115572]|uniref:Zn(II)2Cys6 transcription factor n=1 Tax=Aspergillus sclerotioniger CBS 115572 TaxID=1450535 RepID=A0A317VAL0_9EURO|nr:Zn(II)2Cys6 transcription factor [Aspergillus sclerotioniger CBS 115572]PWY70321.1 Zn(II)2Cys6 transcription factor [Aspergillus sclerotioniger CBS 115572]
MIENQSPLKRPRLASRENVHPAPGSPWSLSYHLADYNSPLHPNDPFQSPTTSWTDGFSEDPGYLASQEELRCILFTLANSTAPTRVSSPDPIEHTQPQPQTPLTNETQIQYLKNYITEIAPWLDMFDTQCTFRQQVPLLARTFPALSYAMLAISARQIERKTGVRNWFDSLELYQEAIRHLSPLLQLRDPKIIAACVLLCCLEMMSARAQDWRRHLEGCAALFESFGITGFSEGLLRAVFWCFARMDLCGALISDGTQTTLLHPSKWIPEGEDARGIFQRFKSPDMHANYAVYLCVKSTELISDRTKFVELNEPNDCTAVNFSTRWITLWNDLQHWLSDRPNELLPVQTVNKKPFPRILFIHWAAISSTQLYHTACILLLKMKPKNIPLPQSPTLYPLWHARHICGISLTNPHQGCLNNSIQPLWIAGQLFSHPSEHEQIIQLIQNIENETGWGTCWRIRDLEIAWGVQVHSSTQ